MLIGRKKQQAELLEAYNSDDSRFVALYGRRRVGKTYLIKQTFKDKFTFSHSGLANGSLQEQLYGWRSSLENAGYVAPSTPKHWLEAFDMLKELIRQSSAKKKVVFIDEMPWMDTHKSNFVRSLDHFWNSWATARKDIILIICGSATSWIINNIIMNYGGLHNRLTNQIFLEPFSLRECQEFCEKRKLGYTERQILEAYMALGGIPYYWNFLKRGQSVAQNFDRMFFSERGELTQEFNALYASLFKRPTTHISIITALASKKMGMLRKDILDATGLSDNTTFSNALQELEQCGFIRKFMPIGGKSKNAIYQLMDNYTLFYFDFIKKNTNQDEHYWTANIDTTIHNGWAGRAFERVCIQHIRQIKTALGFAAVISTAHSWVYKPKDSSEKGVQIDLLIDRNDQTINLCEMKYTNAPYTISEEEDIKIRNRKAVFIKETGTNKSILITMITTYGLTPGGYADDIHCQVTMKDLFRI